ncbi:hypothetical protein HPB50_000801 [Hyalomma asiaticum]|uniref:Uncharacterized protein n=1 Tax=Hyalomma asiaticum TaxID=266040 RepID=A0ACB7TAU0_HYAAI|nr:hypothetical protein HPB50_000801 [Hyalomma asiaticum]
MSRECTKPKTRGTLRAEEKHQIRSRSDNTYETSINQVNCFLKSTGGSLPVVNGLLNARSPINICIDTRANVSLISPQALPPTATLTAWTSGNNIKILDRTIQLQMSAEVDIMVGTTWTTLLNVVVSHLPKPIDMILGSDWRRKVNVQVIFHPTNDITLVNVTKEDAQPPTLAIRDFSSSSNDTKSAEILIASFCRDQQNYANEFIRIGPMESEPDEILC